MSLLKTFRLLLSTKVICKVRLSRTLLEVTFGSSCSPQIPPAVVNTRSRALDSLIHLVLCGKQLHTLALDLPSFYHAFVVSVLMRLSGLDVGSFLLRRCGKERIERKGEDISKQHQGEDMSTQHQGKAELLVHATIRHHTPTPHTPQHASTPHANPTH
jgi:hypothetical protein